MPGAAGRNKWSILFRLQEVTSHRLLRAASPKRRIGFRENQQQEVQRATHGARSAEPCGSHLTLRYMLDNISRQESSGLCQAMFSFRAKSTASFRSADRDRETDEQRLAAIKNAVQQAVEAAQREKSALGHRLEEALMRATILAGTDTYEHEARLPEKTAGLAEAEAEMSRAEGRLLDLDRHILKLQRIEAAILDE